MKMRKEMMVIDFTFLFA